jgi:hypothetical protein
MYKKIILFLSIILLLIGNIGLTIFSHTCKKEGVFISLYFKGEHDCKLEAAEETPPCCREVTTKKDCCKDEINIYKLDLDYLKCNADLSTLDLVWNTVPLSTSYEKHYQLLDKKIVSHPEEPPPKCFGRTLLIQQQIMRI